MKKRKISLELIVGIASLITSMISVMGVVWVGAFKLSTLSHEVQDIKENVKEMKQELREHNARFERIEFEFHKMDIRMNTLEHRKP